ncbi:hypothetical protein H2200_011969 [Cladophialophora chaetospira]|uniref:Polyketide cyclase/dehydrase n=1 Tax=Cladophialophora chaetospira TaxID=386627 RepID=A0AA38WZ42_9EURO|nr:hypothetical protein H2200_011969 [Cladophialophora chaetospira]
MAQRPSDLSAWPPSSGLTTPIVPRKDTVLTCSASVQVHAPASLVFDTILNVNDYSWNQWVPRVSINSQPEGVDKDSETLHMDTEFTFHVMMKPSSETPTQLKVTDISTPENPSSYIPTSTLENDGTYSENLQEVYRIAWKVHGGFASRGLKGERFHEIIALGENECEVRTWENQGGVLAHAVKWMYKHTLMEKFQLWCDDLKRASEEKAARG